MYTIPELMLQLNAIMASCKDSEKYKKAKSAEKSRMLYSSIAVGLAFKCTPIPSDQDLVPRQYILTIVNPLCEELLAKINEIEIIDYKLIMSMIPSLYMTRYNLAHGICSVEDMYTLIEQSTMVSKELKDYLKCED